MRPDELRNHKRAFTYLDAVIALFIIAVGAYIAYRIKIGLNYKWDWATIAQYMVHKNPETHRWEPNLLLQGLITTLRLSVWATLLATAMGFVAGFFRISDSLFKRMLGRTFVELIRNTPPLVLIFLFYFFVSDQIMPLTGIDAFLNHTSPLTQNILSFLLASPSNLSAFLSAMITVAIFEAAYIAEIVRAGIQSIEKGQFEASQALGLSWWQQMRHIILPQAVTRILPPLANQFISTIKDSAIVSVISIQELTFQGMQIMASTYLTFECWITITGLYLVLTFTLSLAAARLERYLRKNMG